MNTVEQEVEIRETAGLKSCNGCSRELREGDRFCRRCGADQNGSVVRFTGYRQEKE